jgi:hypothetical protein
VLNESNDWQISLDRRAKIEAYRFENQRVAFGEVGAHGPRQQQKRATDKLANQAIPAAREENRLTL